MAKNPILISFAELTEMNENADNLDPATMPEYSPLSGDEPKYDPKKWNENDKIRRNHNCYAYVLGKIAAGRRDKPQPGYFSGHPPLRTSDYTCDEFYERLRKDIPGGMYKVSFSKPCKRGYHKGFITLADGSGDRDYHFYIQNRDGLWSHKPGRTPATDRDASGKVIKNPLLANRKYEHFNYKTPCFFFCVNPNLARAHSKR